MLDSAVKNAGIEEYLEEILSVGDDRIFKVHPSVYQLAVDPAASPPVGYAFSHRTAGTSRARLISDTASSG